MAAKRLEIVCSSCGADTLLKREPIYEGFTRTGERFRCGSCGHEFKDESEVPYKEIKKPSVFQESDAPQPVKVFAEEGPVRNCRHCRHYVVNPFVQRCGLHQKPVQATDVCDDFSRKEPEESPDLGAAEKKSAEE